MRRRLHAACNHFDRTPTRTRRRYPWAPAAWWRGLSSDESDGRTLLEGLPVTLPAHGSGWSSHRPVVRVPLPWLGGRPVGPLIRITSRVGGSEPIRRRRRSARRCRRAGGPVVPGLCGADSGGRSTDPAPWPVGHGKARCRSGGNRASGPGQAFPNTSASAASGSMPATILALILTALTALVAPVWRMTAMISSRIAR